MRSKREINISLGKTCEELFKLRKENEELKLKIKELIKKLEGQ